VIGVGTCSNCGAKMREHCTVHLIACCPGKCSAAVRVLTAIITCREAEGGCGEEYDGIWPGEADGDEQDRAEAPVADQECPACHHVQSAEYPGWSFLSEAG
jgi:hypothetical protein